MLETIPFIDECDESNTSFEEVNEIRTVSVHVDELKSDDEIEGQHIFTIYEQQNTNNYHELKEKKKRRRNRLGAKNDFQYSVGK
jgi:hypothetical protein